MCGSLLQQKAKFLCATNLPQLLVPDLSFFGWEGWSTRIDYRNKLVPLF